MNYETPFKRLIGLGKQRLDFIRERLAKGDSALKLAKMIQDDWGEGKDIALASLQKQLRRYADAIVKPEVFEGALTQVEKIGRQAARIDCIAEMTNLVELQIKRVAKLQNLEGDKPLLLGMLSLEMDRLFRFADTLAKMQMEIGALPRAPKTIAGVLGVGGGPIGSSTMHDPRIISFRWTERMQALAPLIDAAFEEYDSSKPDAGGAPSDVRGDALLGNPKGRA